MIDLHTHSTASDGSCTPEKLIALALGMGLSALALTDHDTLDGLERSRRSAENTTLRFIPGVEIEIEREKGEFHLLGLGIYMRQEGLAAALAKVQAARRSRNRRMVEKLQNAGIAITMEELATTAGGDIVSRAHFARLLVQKKVVSSIDAAFKRLIGKGMPFYEPRECLPLAEATSLIRAAGGVSVIAHPLSLGLRGPVLRAFCLTCRDQGVAGLEAWHPNHSPQESRQLERLAQSLGMAVTGGSDFHGEHMPQRKLGLSAGGREVPDSFLDALPPEPGAPRSRGASLHHSWR
ncbi:MAG: PHP domain-containing protein [Spirochaetia bacterium]|jgi:predicted metal-dependent phosphoesterase TrpH